MTKEEVPAERSSVAKLGWSAYQHVAGVFGAFALAAFVGNFVELDWRSLLGTFVGLWEETVRPAVKSVLDLLISTPMKWLGWQAEIPLAVRDYFSVGAILPFP